MNLCSMEFLEEVLQVDDSQVDGPRVDDPQVDH